jgi:hypothetical protein
MQMGTHSGSEQILSGKSTYRIRNVKVVCAPNCASRVDDTGVFRGSHGATCHQPSQLLDSRSHLMGTRISGPAGFGARQLNLCYPLEPFWVKQAFMSSFSDIAGDARLRSSDSPCSRREHCLCSSFDSTQGGSGIISRYVVLDTRMTPGVYDDRA